MLYVLILFMTILGSIAGFTLKKSTDEQSSLINILKSKYLYIGLFLYLASAIINILVLKQMDYSVVLPMTSITYIWSMILAYKYLNEKITKIKIFGIIFIVLGCIFIGLS